MSTWLSKDFLLENENWLDNKKPQTTYKIKYISKYIENWLYVVTNIPNIKNINFVDCMCNAGVYTDGDKGTAIKALEWFNEFAPKHLDKTFNLILNDISKEKLEIIKFAIKTIGIKSPNIKFEVNNVDVNDFISNKLYFKQYFDCRPMLAANLVFVDPYNFCTVRPSLLQSFLTEFYCELIYNVFTSDFVRNQDKDKHKKFCDQEGIECKTKDEMVQFIVDKMKVGAIKHTFTYEFKISSNTELYQIMFFTPSIKGLEKLKDALWDTFDGKEFYRNPTQGEKGQMSIFTAEEEKDWRIEFYSSKAKEQVLERFSTGNEIDYKTIEDFIIENTMLNSNKVLECVLKPLIFSGKVRKMGYVARSSNYKSDKYIIGVN